MIAHVFAMPWLLMHARSFRLCLRRPRLRCSVGRFVVADHTSLLLACSVPLTVVEGRKPARAVCVGLDAAVAPRSASLRESVNPEMRDSNDNGVHWPIMDTGKKVGNETRTLATSVMTSSNDGRPLGNPTSIFSPSGSIQNGKNGPFAVPLSQRVFKDSTSSNTPPAKMSAIASLSTTPRAGLRQPSSLLQYNASIQGQPRYGDMPSRSAQQHQPVRGKHHMQVGQPPWN